jgi:serine/threonine protein kinase
MPIDQRTIIDALVQTTRKRRILPKGPSQRLGEYAAQKGIASLDDLRAWLAAGDGLSSDLAKKLLEFLPPKDAPAFGPYIPLTHLADGGMGTVWLAAAPDGTTVVVKTLKGNLPGPKDGSQATEYMRRFEREARITQQLQHPNVVRCLDNGVAPDGSLFMVLEYVDSGDLRDVVEARAGLTEPLALAILYQVVDGLAEAHRIKLVHRDIKPPNIFVSQDGTAKLADFGIARSTEQNRTMLTMQGAIVGSPLYMSPEQVLTDPTLDIRSDIYALGAVLYFCLAGHAPYDGKLQEILHKHCTAPVPDVRKKRPAVSDRTQAIISTCMAKERKQRYTDPAAMRAAIADVLTGLGMKPGTKVDEDTVDMEIGSAALKASTARIGLPDERTLAVNLNQPQSSAAPMLEDLTITADLSAGSAVTMPSGQVSPAADNDFPTITTDLSSDGAAVTMPSGAMPAVDDGDHPTIANAGKPREDRTKPGTAAFASAATMPSGAVHVPDDDPHTVELTPARIPDPAPATSASLAEPSGTINLAPSARPPARPIVPAPAQTPAGKPTGSQAVKVPAAVAPAVPAQPARPAAPGKPAAAEFTDYKAESRPLLADFDEIKTLTANLMSQDAVNDLAAAMAKAQGKEPGTSATLAINRAKLAGTPVPGAVKDAFVGDFGNALATDWVDLVSPIAGDPSQVMLFARTRLLMGKLREAPVDLCLRNYPIAVHKDACQRISRMHLVLRYDAVMDQCRIEDQNAPNGTLLDGITVPPGGTATMNNDEESILVLSNTVSLWLRALPRRGGLIAIDGVPAATTQPNCGIDTPVRVDAITIIRRENRPELAYAMVLRRLTIGGPGAELVLAGARTRAAVEIAVYNNRWIWRPTGTNIPWKPLTEGTEIDCGGKPMKATAGSYTRF